MGHNYSTPRVIQIWSNIFEPIVIPPGECQTVRTTYNIHEPPLTKSDLPQPHDEQPNDRERPTTQFFDLWTPSNLFNAVQPLRNDYKVRAKIQKLLSSITMLSPEIPEDLQLPLVINIYLARRKSPEIDDTQLSTYITAVYGTTVLPKSISMVGKRICNFDTSPQRQTHTSPYKRFEKFCARFLKFDRDRAILAHFEHSGQDLTLFMDSVWLSMSPSAQMATMDEWTAYAEPALGNPSSNEL